MNKYAVVLAAGKGTRMKSSLHKVLHQVSGKSMVDHAVTNLEKIGVEKIVTVIGYEAESVQSELKDRVEYAMQTPNVLYLMSMVGLMNLPILKDLPIDA